MHLSRENETKIVKITHSDLLLLGLTYVLGVLRTCPPRPRKLNTTHLAPRFRLPILTKDFIYSDWESPVKPGRNKHIGDFSLTDVGLVQSKQTSPPSNSLRTYIFKETANKKFHK